MKYQAADGEGEVLPNRLGLTERAAVEQAETQGFLLAEQELLEELREDQVFDAAYLQELHRRALGEVYEFAGRYRSVNMSKGGFTFPAALHLPQSMAAFEREMLLPLPHAWPTTADLVRDVARVHAELLFIHPFREGNGRTARVLANLMAYKNGSTSFQWEKLAEPEQFALYVRAVQAAGRQVDYGPMEAVIRSVLPSELA
ncbi:cell filamentation protein Fic [Hymenobacter aquaticus]|uniref:protein adenylyltransferase n=1 Tax=Hymenobacter aquaticus TaxID=1867101 RepID=A0A4Z0Q5K3_9BACT|nr:Fic family protein [Hymenobacter aquaticus]TGE23952.1 cell filamentation protein Fic [Hymenobacter aquaticus]